MAQLDKSTDDFAKLNMYFVASRLFRKIGNTRGMRRCDTILENSFRSCENSKYIHEKQLKSASSVLNSMAYGFIPIHLIDTNLFNKPWARPSKTAPFTEKDFEESEKLKLRAAAMVDRLPANSDLRRTHRDLALWYMELGKMEMAEKEKQTLFELVGAKDDSLLYPRAGGCGSVVWWQTGKEIIFGCGRG